MPLFIQFQAATPAMDQIKTLVWLINSLPPTLNGKKQHIYAPFNPLLELLHQIAEELMKKYQIDKQPSDAPQAGHLISLTASPQQE